MLGELHLPQERRPLITHGPVQELDRVRLPAPRTEEHSALSTFTQAPGKRILPETLRVPRSERLRRRHGRLPSPPLFLLPLKATGRAQSTVLRPIAA
ncbi:hypothetical protein GCM10009850_057430 [Nonomuraea monospora]|uniref:Uncharacterized protein n=1 Tax=Nonomuraea monospora TaxID=568818 RepID=A0ABN3CLG9_9ACTN